MRINDKQDLYNIRCGLVEDLREAYEIFNKTPLDTPENRELLGEIGDRIQAAQAFLHALDDYIRDIIEIEDNYGHRSE